MQRAAPSTPTTPGFAQIVSSGILNREYSLDTDIAKAYIDFLRSIQRKIETDINIITQIDHQITPQHAISTLSSIHDDISETLTAMTTDYKIYIQHQLSKLKALHIALKQPIGRPKKYHTAFEKAEARRKYRATYKAKHSTPKASSSLSDPHEE